ncbi:MAG: tRNA epoxyqueuosine(34) reductase QueG, partial [Bacteroidetes bacterium]|nr:tRNA epoxyqueuosine(34) reductase QueG [Bacteroidota bacterium]
MNNSLIAQNTQIVRQIAAELGFDFVGISVADFLEEDAPLVEKWLKNKQHAQMQYMENYFDMRLDPRKLHEGTRSVISLMYNYFPTKKQLSNTYKISRYAYGEDYHFVIKKILKEFVQKIEAKIGAISARYFVDSAPVLERAWAKKSGLGWQGKNTMLINPKAGSYYFLAEILTDLPLLPDNPMHDYCGTCQRCIEACPTEALTPYWLNAEKCISYATIELKDQISEQVFGNKMENWIFGCDICQEVCPWNKFAKPHQQVAFEPDEKLIHMKNEDWELLTETMFSVLFKKSAIKRTKYAGLKRNI